MANLLGIAIANASDRSRVDAERAERAMRARRDMARGTAEVMLLTAMAVERDTPRHTVLAWLQSVETELLALQTWVDGYIRRSVRGMACRYEREVCDTLQRMVGAGAAETTGWTHEDVDALAAGDMSRWEQLSAAYVEAMDGLRVGMTSLVGRVDGVEFLVASRSVLDVVFGHLERNHRLTWSAVGDAAVHTINADARAGMVEQWLSG